MKTLFNCIQCLVKVYLICNFLTFTHARARALQLLAITFVYLVDCY